MPDSVLVRKARLSDVPVLADFAVELMKTHEAYDSFFYSMSSNARKAYFLHFKKAVRSRKWLLLVAMVDSKIAGFVLAALEKRPPIYRVAKKVFLHDIFVDEKYRGKGISRQLFQGVLDFAKKHKVKMLQVIVDERNAHAIEVYKKFGFEDYDKTMALALK